MNDDDIIRQRIAGKSVRAIAKTQRRSAAEINAVIDRWTSCPHGRGDKARSRP
jgi:hypothetical protein